MRSPRLLLLAGLLVACRDATSTSDAAADVTDATDITDITDITDVTDATDAADVADVAPDLLDASTEGGTDCVLPGYGTCARGTTCVIARCPDGTPVSCFCSPQGEPRCTGACPPPPDAGVTCGAPRSQLERPPCAPATPTLDPMICRCILGYAWDGSACASLANCHCYAGCDEVYMTREACLAAHAHCGDAGR